MDTRPKHVQMIETARDFCAANEVRSDVRCPRQRFFVEARKRDDGDRPPGARGTERSPACACRREALTKHSASRHEQGAHGAPWTPGSERRSESFMNNAG